MKRLSALWMIPAFPAMLFAATNVFFSVGTNTSDLKSGSPTITISSGTATLSIAQPNNIGVGDEITFAGGTKCYISGRSSSTVFSVTTATGAVPSNVTGQTVNSILRAFNSLSAAVTGAGNPSHLNTMDLVANNLALHLACYGDGNDVNQAVLDGWTTGPNNFVRIFTPVSSAEVGVSQRHGGKWTSSGAYALKIPSVSTGDMLTIRDDYVRVDGLQVDAFGSSATGQDGINLHLSATADGRISNCILKGPKVASTAIGKNGTGNFYAWNNILYDWYDGSVGANGIGIWGDNAFVYNNTIYGCYYAINTGASTVATLKNNLSYGNAVNYAGYNMASGSNNLSGPYASASIPAASARNGVNVTFVDSANDDFHLASNDAGALNYGADLSADNNMPFSTDLEGQTRSGSWEIGADEYLADPVPPVMGTVTSPNAGAGWATGATRSIQWTGSDETALARFHLDYSLTNGSTWIAIGDTSVTGTSFGGGKAWTVPVNVAAVQCKIRVIAVDGNSNADTAESLVFSIVDTIAPTVSVSLPAGGVSWQAGTPQTIQWSASDNIAVSACSLYYTTDGTSWIAIAATSGTTNTYSWTVTGPASSSARIQIRAKDAFPNTGTGNSAVFTITTPDTTPPTLSGVGLAGSPTTIASGSSQTITWTTSDNQAVVRCSVWISYNNGSNYAFLSQATGTSITTGSVAWAVPAGRTATAAMIRVTAYDAATNAATATSGAFEIRDETPPYVVLQTPNGDEAWPATSTQMIAWSAFDSIGITACSLFYSTDNGAWTLIWDSTASPSVYGWKLPLTASAISKVKVVVSDAAGHVVSDVSDDPFRITRSPFITSPDSILVLPGQDLTYIFTHDAGGQTGSAQFTAVNTLTYSLLGTMVIGPVPTTPVPRVDTVVVRFALGTYSENFKLRVMVQAPTGISAQAAVPRTLAFSVEPSRSSVVFRVGLDRAGGFEVVVYNIAGRKVWGHRNTGAAPGYHAATWNPGNAVNGSYVAELRSQGRVVRQKLAVLK